MTKIPNKLSTTGGDDEEEDEEEDEGLNHFYFVFESIIRQFYEFIE